jgi:hypothetical protein
VPYALWRVAQENPGSLQWGILFRRKQGAVKSTQQYRSDMVNKVILGLRLWFILRKQHKRNEAVSFTLYFPQHGGKLELLER